MTRQRSTAVILILIGCVFALAPFVGTVSNLAVWLAAVIFVGLGIYQLVQALRK